MRTLKAINFNGYLALDSATISNAIEQFEVRDRAAGYADMGLRCQFPEYPPMVGYAVTCTADTTSPGESRPMKFADVLQVVRDAPQPANHSSIAVPSRTRSTSSSGIPSFPVRRSSSSCP